MAYYDIDPIESTAFNSGTISIEFKYVEKIVEMESSNWVYSISKSKMENVRKQKHGEFLGSVKVLISRLYIRLRTLQKGTQYQMLISPYHSQWRPSGSGSQIASLLLISWCRCLFVEEVF